MSKEHHDTIGSATMEPDGTIVQWLRADDENGTIGHAVIRRSPGEPRYDDLLEHLGGMKPGETKPVPAWS
jgi:hypothetical protein